MDCAVDAPAPPKRVLGGIDDCIDFQFGDVASLYEQ
jgi:hypothetical protein